MGMKLTKILAVGAMACAVGMGSLAPAFAGSAGAADSRGPQRPPDANYPHNGGGGNARGGWDQQRQGSWRADGGGGNNRGDWHGQRQGGWRGDGDGDGHRRDGGFGWAPFVFGGLAAGALVEATTPHFYGQPYDGDPCYQLTPTYDQWNNYVGRQWVNVCE